MELVIRKFGCLLTSRLIDKYTKLRLATIDSAFFFTRILPACFFDSECNERFFVSVSVFCKAAVCLYWMQSGKYMSGCLHSSGYLLDYIVEPLVLAAAFLVN